MFRRWPKRDPNKYYYLVPNEVFNLGLSSHEIAVYNYLLRCEDRRTYAHTREECEEKLKVLIVEMKAEIAEAQRLKDMGEGDGQPPEEKKCKRGKKK